MLFRHSLLSRIQKPHWNLSQQHQNRKHLTLCPELTFIVISRPANSMCTPWIDLATVQHGKKKCVQHAQLQQVHLRELIIGRQRPSMCDTLTAGSPAPKWTTQVICTLTSTWLCQARQTFSSFFYTLSVRANIKATTKYSGKNWEVFVSVSVGLGLFRPREHHGRRVQGVRWPKHRQLLCASDVGNANCRSWGKLLFRDTNEPKNLRGRRLFMVSPLRTSLLFFRPRILPSQWNRVWRSCSRSHEQRCSFFIPWLSPILAFCNNTLSQSATSSVQ